MPIHEGAIQSTIVTVFARSAGSCVTKVIYIHTVHKHDAVVFCWFTACVLIHREGIDICIALSTIIYSRMTITIPLSQLLMNISLHSFHTADMQYEINAV